MGTVLVMNELADTHTHTGRVLSLEERAFSVLATGEQRRRATMNSRHMFLRARVRVAGSAGHTTLKALVVWRRHRCVVINSSARSCKQ